MPTISIQSQAKSKQPAPKDAAELVLHYKGVRVAHRLHSPLPPSPVARIDRR